MTTPLKKEKITLDTPVHMSVKILLSLLGGMLILFFGFYGVVIQPKQTEQDARLDKQELEATNQHRITNQQLMEINNGIGTLSGTMEGINLRFKDLREQRNATNTSGGFTNE